MERPQPTDGLVDALAQAAFLTMGVLTRVAAEHDLSLTQLRVLGILRDRRVRMSELAEYLGLEKSTMTGLVDRAEQRGLIERARSESDGRSVEVFLSPPGAQLAARLAVAVGRSLAPLTEGHTAAEQDRLRILLARLTPPD